jgi:hypothetical protein
MSIYSTDLPMLSVKKVSLIHSTEWWWEKARKRETDIHRAKLMRKIGRGRKLKRNKNTQVFFFVSK